MKQNKIKDLVLQKAYGKPSVSAQGISGNPDETQRAIVELHNEGFVQIQHKATNRSKVSIITYAITDLGTQIVNDGGYAKSKRKTKINTLSRKTWAIIGFIVGVLFTAIANKLIDVIFQILHRP